jgi:hypothetical protein
MNIDRLMGLITRLARRKKEAYVANLMKIISKMDIRNAVKDAFKSSCYKKSIS